MSDPSVTLEVKPPPTKKESAAALLTSIGVDLSSVQQGTVNGTPLPTPTPTPIPIPEPKARVLSWKQAPKVWYVGDTLTVADLVDDDANLGNAVLAEPKTALQAASSDALAVKITAAAKDGFKAAELMGTVAILKRKASIIWKTPPPVVVNTQLGGATLNATRDPIDLPVTYDPAPNTRVNVLGQNTLTVTSSDAVKYEAVAPVSVMLTVVANRSDLAKAFGTVEMETGRAWKPMDPVLDDKAIKMMEKWDKDVGNLRTQAKEIVTALNGMTEDELKTYMNGKKKEKGFKDFNQMTLGPNGGPSEFPNDIWRFDNGLQVRYKPNGDSRNKGKPMFCVEVRTSDDLSEKQDGAACKVMPDGQPGPKGNDTTLIPNWISTMQPGHVKDGLEADFMNSACSMTHLKCAPKQDQVITWLDPAVVDVGAVLKGAAALGGVTCSYVLAGKSIKAGAVLPGGADQSIQVTTPGTDRYKPGDRSFTITVNKKPQVLTWGGAFVLTMDEELTDVHLCASRLGGAQLTYATKDGETIEAGDVAGEKLQHGVQDVFVTSGETAEYAAGPATKASFTLDKLEQDITWEAPEDVVAGTDASSLHTATWLGQDEDHGPQTITYTVLDSRGELIQDDDPLPEGKIEAVLNLEDSDWYEDGEATLKIIVKKAPSVKKKGR